MKYSNYIAVLLAGTVLAASSVMAQTMSEKRQEMHMHDVENPLNKTDADMDAVLSARASLHPEPIENLSPDEARKQPTPADGVKLVMQKKGMDPANTMGVATRNISLSGAEGDIPARIYTPEGADTSRPLPVVVYYHGGGWVIGDLDSYDATPRIIAKKVNAIVVSVEYRKAPENRFPAAHEDAFAAYKWVLANAATFGGDASRVAVMGESAGGNLAINVAIAARDNHIPLPVYQVLVYPVAGTDMETHSYNENANAKPLNKPMMSWFMKYVIRDDQDKKDTRIDLVNYDDFGGLPPATVITAQIDPLRSEGKKLAHKLEGAGVKVDYENYSGVTHEFFGMGAVVAKAREAEKRVISDLNKAFAK